jgi:superfamily II DNA or RNA helicase
MKTNQIKGYNYEVQIRDYIINELRKPAYLWSDTPETILVNNGIIGSHNINRLIRQESKQNNLQDTGIDIIQVDSNENLCCSLVQCKNGYKKGITMNDLSGFMCWMTVLDKLKGYIYYTDKLSNPLKYLPKSNRVEYIKQPYLINEKEKEVIISELKPFDYQIKAKDTFINYFQENNRGILSMPCGTGKTYTSYLISENYNQIIIISPLKQFAKQNLDRYIEYGYPNKTLLVDSDGERDVDEIKKFIKSNPQFLISATFCSVDVIEKCLELFDHSLLIIVDEFHNLSKSNVTDENDDFNKILSNQDGLTNYRILFMSATPRVYELELEDEDSNQDIFGEIVYNMTFTEAIENKYITDYKIWLPSIHEDNNTLNEELSIYEIDSVIKSKCNYLFSCILNNGSKKCIIYCQDTKEICEMRNAILKLNEYYYLDYEVNQITSSDNAKNRTDILEKFANSNKIQLLFSIRILDECIDIPSCDSIYITYPSQSKIRTIQRLSRCIRIDKNNPFKIGNIYIWCNEYDQILETLSGIKEYDLFFKDKIKINETNFFGNSIKDGITVDIKLVEKFVLGIKEFKATSWDEKLEWVKRYIDDNGKRPLQQDENKEIRSHGSWLRNQHGNYINNKQIMKDDIRNKWITFINDSKYKKYFLSNEDDWNNTLELVKKYIDDNNKRPSNKDKDKNKIIQSYGTWIGTQQDNYKNKTFIMKNEEIYNKWYEFITDSKYKKYFISNEDEWISKLNIIKKYINDNNKKPSPSDKIKEIRSYNEWLNRQQINYLNNICLLKNIEIKNKWIEFINDSKYKKYFISDEDNWKNTLEIIKKYIDDNHKRPSHYDKNKQIQSYGHWISNQNTNYKDNLTIMKNEEIKTKWELFINDDKYKKFFFSDEDNWKNTLYEIKKYIDDNNKRPSSSNKNKEIKKFANWLNNQSRNYIKNDRAMNNIDLKNLWIDFINDPKYKKYI